MCFVCFLLFTQRQREDLDVSLKAPHRHFGSLQGQSVLLWQLLGNSACQDLDSCIFIIPIIILLKFKADIYVSPEVRFLGYCKPYTCVKQEISRSCQIGTLPMQNTMFYYSLKHPHYFCDETVLEFTFVNFQLGLLLYFS